MGIEPTFSAWEADVLPLNYTRYPHDLAHRQKYATKISVRNRQAAIVTDTRGGDRRPQEYSVEHNVRCRIPVASGMRYAGFRIRNLAGLPLIVLFFKR